MAFYYIKYINFFLTIFTTLATPKVYCDVYCPIVDLRDICACRCLIVSFMWCPRKTPEKIDTVVDASAATATAGDVARSTATAPPTRTTRAKRSRTGRPRRWTFRRSTSRTGRRRWSCLASGSPTIRA
jgi:hypothetical protein